MTICEIRPKSFSEIIDNYRIYRERSVTSWTYNSIPRHGLYRPWADSIIPIKAAEEFFSFTMNEIAKWKIPEGRYTLNSSLCKQGKKEHYPHNINEDYAIGIGVYVNILPEEKDLLKRVIESQFKITRLARTLGGKACPHGWSTEFNYNENNINEIIESLH